MMLRTRAGLAATFLLSLAALAGCGQVTTVNGGGGTDVAIAPTITSQPASQVVSSGQQASFTVVAEGSDPLNYQWRRNGALISGAATPTYTTPANEADDGASFSVVVSNPVGTIESETVKLTVQPVTVAPTITTQPSDQAITSGQSASFSVAASGTAPLSYQWQKNGAAIAGATAASYTTAPATTADGGTSFAVLVTNPAGSITSRSATLTVTESGGGAVAPAITAQPADQTAKSGQTATFTVGASGTAPLTYQWLRNGLPLSGATSATYTTAVLATSDGGAAFSVSIKNSAGSITSRAALLTVSGTAPTITTQPADQTVKAGQSAAFTVAADGTAPLSYQWQKNGASISGATSTSYATPATTTTDSGATFSVVVSNSAGSIPSRAAKLTVNAAAPTISTQPADATVTTGSSATFSVVAAGTAPLTYQWQKGGIPISGATAANYTTPGALSSDSGSGFAVVVTNSGGSTTSRTAVLTVTGAAPSITAQPADQSVHSGQTATFSVTAAGSGPLSYQWRKNGTTIPGASGTSFTTAATSTADSGTSYLVVVSNSSGSITSRSAQLTVTAALTQGSDVVTYKNDLARTGQNLNEKILTPANVNSSGFGKQRFLSTDGKVDAQPLYLSALTIGGAAHNVVFIATENDSVYAFDADNGTQLWKVSLVPAGETVNDLPPQSCDQVSPTIGITSTPVIDRSAGARGTIYLVAMTKSTSSATWHHRLHALDVTTGTELLGGPKEITASYPAASGTITFDPVQYEERAALLLSNHTIYTSWTSHCDHQFYTGWIIAYSQSTLQQTAVLNVAPNSGGQGPAIWMAGGGPAADSAGNVYLLTANGVFEETLDANGFPNQHDFGNSFLKLSTGGGSLTVADYFALSNTAFESNNDMDLGSGGIMLLPDLADATGTTRHLAIGAGKDGNIYVVNRDSMGHFSKGGNNIWQQLTGALGNRATGGELGGVWSTPAYFDGRVYFGASGGHVAAFSISAAKLTATPTSSATSFFYPGTSPVISANGSSNGIVWAHQNTNPAVLYAFDATNTARELYNSSQAGGGRDQFGAGNKFITPMVADGKVFVATTNGVAVFGLLN
jgi:Immunoglobulin domain/Immunoglobulin I-set domain/PQQ-like domain